MIRFKNCVSFVVLLSACALAIPLPLRAAEISSIDFIGTLDPNEINIRASGAFQYTLIENAQDKQVVAELKGVTLSKDKGRAIDTSSFASKVSLISPYSVPGEQTVRIVIQLREMVPVVAQMAENRLTLRVPKSDQTKEQLATEASQTGGAGLAGGASALAKSVLDDFSASQATRRYIGKPITLQLRNAELTDVFRLIGEASGFNIVLGDDVKGKITVSLIDVPWDQALDVVLHTSKLGAERSANVLRVGTLTGLTQQKLEELAAKKAAEANAPLITRVFAINYALLQDMKNLLDDFVTKNSGGAVANAPKASVSIDARTNSIIVRDIPDNMDRIKKLIEMLDTQTPQVLIESKIVEIKEDFLNQVSGSLGLGNLSLINATGGNVATNTAVNFLGTANTWVASNPVTGDNPWNAGVGQSPLKNTPGMGLNLSPRVNILGANVLNAILALGENETKAKIITSPKTVVINKRKAVLTQSEPVTLAQTFSNGLGGTAAGNVVVDANIKLTCTPTVTNDGSVLLELEIIRETPGDATGGGSGIFKKTINTLVLVDSGATLAIGGMYVNNTSETSGGVPFLRKIPLLGALFGTDKEQTTRSELFFFITPKILNTKEAGLPS